MNCFVALDLAIIKYNFTIITELKLAFILWLNLSYYQLDLLSRRIIFYFGYENEFIF